MTKEPENIRAESIVVDAHCDTFGRYLAGGDYRFGGDNDRGEVDLSRALEAGVTAIVFAASEGGVAEALRVIDAIRREAEANADRFTIATRTEDIREAKRAGKLAGIIALEGGHLIEADLAALDMFHRRGVRLMTLVHKRKNAIAESCTDMPEGTGLTGFGREVVAEMNRLGMLVDVAHISPAGFDDVLATSRTPVVCSHGNALALCRHVRNYTDDQMRGLARTGGVLGVSAVPHFINDDRDTACFARFIDHVMHIVGVMGVDGVGIGTDFDGFKGAAAPGLEDVRCLANVADAFVRRGLSARDAEKVLGANFLRVISEVIG